MSCKPPECVSQINVDRDILDFSEAFDVINVRIFSARLVSLWTGWIWSFLVYHFFQGRIEDIMFAKATVPSGVTWGSIMRLSLPSYGKQPSEWASAFLSTVYWWLTNWRKRCGRGLNPNRFCQNVRVYFWIRQKVDQNLLLLFSLQTQTLFWFF